MKTKLFTLSIAVLFLSGCVNSNPITGYWVGLMEMNGKTVDVSIDFNEINGSFSSNDLMILGMPISDLKMNNSSISFSYIDDINILFEGTIENEKISGKVNIQGVPSSMKINFNLRKESETSPVKSYSIEKLTVKSDGTELSANIYMPKMKNIHPALVLLHGSSMNLKGQYTFYADYFANLGFEVLVFDKRGNGESTGDNRTATYNNLVDDAIACLEVMKNRGSVDKKKIGLWGYSQGAMLLPRVVTKTNIPSFLIAKSPEVFSAVEGAAYSDSLRVVNSGNTFANGHIAAECHRIVGDMIHNGSGYKEVENFIRQNAQQYSFMNQTGLYGNLTINKDEFESLYWKGRAEKFYSYWWEIKIPTLVLFGEDDDLLNAIRNEAVIKSFNNNKIETKLFSHASHNMKKSFNPQKYPDFDWPRRIDEYLDFVERWVEKKIMY